MKIKFEIQNLQYIFPYHYIPYFEQDNIPRNKRILSWGWEYLTYMTYIKNTIIKLNIKNILDVGCGDGYLLNTLEIGNTQKYGIDLSEKAIKFAKAFENKSNFEVKDIFDVNQKYDLVTLIEVLEHIPDEIVYSFVQQVLKLVNVNGYFLISVPSTVMPVNKKHYRHYDEDLLTKHLNPDKHNIELVGEKRIYKKSKLLSFFIRILDNKFFSINSKFILNKFWKWHLNNTLNADINDGIHIIRLYKKKSLI